MTIEEKAKAYDEAIKRAKEINNEQRAQPFDVMTRVFFELKENENEKIRKGIKSILKHYKECGASVCPYPFVSIDEALAWLEKQKEPELSEDLGDYIAELSKQFPEVSFAKLSRIAVRVKKWLEKQDKQKVPVVDFKAKDWYVSKVDGKIHNIYNSVDRIEPKFKVGDIIINIHYKWDGKHRIREITDGKYIFDGGSYINIKEQDSWELANKVEPKFKVGDLIRLKDGDGLEWTIKEMHHDGYYTIVCEDRDDFIYLDDRWELVGKLVDKIEAKFHEGEWVVQGYNILKIKCVGDTYYCFETVSGYVDDMLISEIDSQFHLWTIQDAKDGDVLAVDSKPFIYNGSKNEVTVGAYCGFNTKHKFSFAYNYVINQNITPATKEQRDLLFQKIEEAGYEWDEKTHELKKISQRTISAEAKEALYDKPVEWSEEDEDIVNEEVEVTNIYETDRD